MKVDRYTIKSAKLLLSSIFYFVLNSYAFSHATTQFLDKSEVVPDILIKNDIMSQFSSSNGKDLYISDRDSYIVAQVRDKDCLKHKTCLTVVIYKCESKACPYAFTVAGESFIELDSFQYFMGDRAALYFPEGVTMLLNGENIIVVKPKD